MTHSCRWSTLESPHTHTRNWGFSWVFETDVECLSVCHIVSFCSVIIRLDKAPLDHSSFFQWPQHTTIHLSLSHNLCASHSNQRLCSIHTLPIDLLYNSSSSSTTTTPDSASLVIIIIIIFFFITFTTINVILQVQTHKHTTTSAKLPETSFFFVSTTSHSLSLSSNTIEYKIITWYYRKLPSTVSKEFQFTHTHSLTSFK